MEGFLLNTIAVSGSVGIFFVTFFLMKYFYLKTRCDKLRNKGKGKRLGRKIGRRILK